MSTNFNSQLPVIPPYYSSPFSPSPASPTVETVADQLHQLTPAQRQHANKLAKISSDISSILKDFSDEATREEENFRVKLHPLSSNLDKLEKEIKHGNLSEAKKLFSEARNELCIIHSQLILNLSVLDSSFTRTRSDIRDTFETVGLTNSTHSNKNVALAQESLTKFLNHSLGLVQALETKLTIFGRQLGETSLLPSLSTSLSSLSTSLSLAIQESYKNIDFRGWLQTAKKVAAGAMLLYTAWQAPRTTPSILGSMAFAATSYVAIPDFVVEGRRDLKTLFWPIAIFSCNKTLRSTADWIFTNLSPHIPSSIKPYEDYDSYYKSGYELVANYPLLCATAAYTAGLAVYRYYEYRRIKEDKEEDPIDLDHAFKAWKQIIPEIPQILPAPVHQPLPPQQTPPTTSSVPASSTPSQPASASSTNSTSAQPPSNSPSTNLTPGQPLPNSVSTNPTPDLSSSSSSSTSSTPGQPLSNEPLVTTSSSSTPVPHKKKRKGKEEKKPLDAKTAPASSQEPPKSSSSDKKKPSSMQPCPIPTGKKNILNRIRNYFSWVA